MLWDAGQERIARESRWRRAELYEAARDAVLAADIAVGRAKPRGVYRLPAYVQPERDPEVARADLRRLLADQGRRIRRTRGTSADAMREAFLAQVADQVH
jgi:hypothetical protein